jgi:predicted esterase
MNFFNSCRSLNRVSGIFLALLFLGALLWAEERDPFFKNWFTLKIVDHDSVECVAVLPKPNRQYPVIIYAHGSGDSLINDGNDLRQMAELGFVAVGLEFNQTNEAAIGSQFEVVLRYLGRQKWVNTNAMVWVGFGLGAHRMLDFALQHPEEQPQLLVQLSGSLDLSSIIHHPLVLPKHSDDLVNNFHCHILIIHGDRDELFPIADTKRLVSVLHTNGVAVELRIIPDVPHNLEPEREIVFRSIGEYSRSYLAGNGAWKDYHSVAQWQAEALPLWVFWLPAIAWLVGWFSWSWYRKAGSPKTIKLNNVEIMIRWLATLLATWASAETAIHLVPPHFIVTDRTLSIARRFLIQPNEKADFEYLATQFICQGQKLKILLDHVKLSGYNRELINWQLGDKIYRDCVLSPVITGNCNEQLNWRRPLWEEFYPRVRHESLPEDAAKIVVRHLRERVTIATLPSQPQNVPDIWLKQITDEAGFQIIYVAALRSVGVPARLNSNRLAEFWDGNKWQTSPSPSVMNACR